MKKLFIYLLIILQIAFVFYINSVFANLEKTGTKIRLLTIEEVEDYDPYPLEDYMYVDYRINNIPEEKTDISKKNRDKRIYVVLKEDANGIYDVERATTEKVKQVADDEVLLLGNYAYYDDQNKTHFIRYGIEEINHLTDFGNFMSDDQLMVDVLIGKWGQSKIVDVKKVTQ